MGFRETTLQTEDPAYEKVLGAQNKLGIFEKFSGTPAGQERSGKGV